MKFVIQRVRHAEVKVEGSTVSSIEKGLLVFIGVAKGDSEEEVGSMAKRVSELRIFSDKQGKMNLPIETIEGDLLVVPEFTLYGDCSSGRRPSFGQAANYEEAKGLYESFLTALDGETEPSVSVFGGKFGAHMEVELENDGPVTLILDS